jgi:uncharacterized protein (TIGR02145 family)
LQELHGFGIFGRNSFRMRSLLLIFCLLFVGVCNSQTTGTMTDSRDGKVYKTVVIGTQTWMAENLNVSTFRNGDPIPEAKTADEWIKAGKNKQPAWCYYDNDTANGAKYGKLYNWYAVNDSRGLAPVGYHIPSKVEWIKLTDFLGGESVAGTKMKSTDFGSNFNGIINGTNESGFSGLPGSYRYNFGRFGEELGIDGWWWASTSANANAFQALSCYLVYFRDPLNWLWSDTEMGFSVRCLRD